MKSPTPLLALFLSVAGAATPASAQRAVPEAAAPLPEAAPRLRFLMRLHAPLEAPSPVSEGLLVFHPRAGGYVSGPGIRGRLVAPAGDWVRTLPSGDMRIDVRLNIEADDGSPIYVQYNGVLAKPDAASWARFLAGEEIRAQAWHYVVAPTFETRSERYRWLNRVQAVGKFVSIQTGPNAHVAFDLYAVE